MYVNIDSCSTHFQVCTLMPVYHSRKPVLLSSYFQQTLNNFVNFELFFTKLSKIDPYEKTLTAQVGMHGDMFLWLVANLKQWPSKTGLWE